ncbi:MAG: MarR family transcriptional regulator [Polyangiales bacterium]
MEQHDEAWNPDLYVAYWINQVSRKLLRLHETRLRPLGFGMSAVPILLALAERGPLLQKELTKAMGVEQPTMAEMLARMERDGLLRREPGTTNGRNSRFALTRLARARLSRAKEVLAQGERDATQGLSDDERELFLQLLQRIATNVGLAKEAPETSPQAR